MLKSILVLCATMACTTIKVAHAACDGRKYGYLVQELNGNKLSTSTVSLLAVIKYSTKKNKAHFLGG